MLEFRFLVLLIYRLKLTYTIILFQQSNQNLRAIQVSKLQYRNRSGCRHRQTSNPRSIENEKIFLVRYGRIFGGSWSTNTPYWLKHNRIVLPTNTKVQLHILAVRWQIDFCTPIRYLDLTVSLQATWASKSVLQSVQVYQFVYGLRYGATFAKMSQYIRNIFFRAS